MSNYLYQRLVAPREQSERPFLFLEDGSMLSYRKVCERGNQFAQSLIENGLKPGERVASQVKKSWQALALYLGTIKAGGVLLPLNDTYTANEVAYYVDNAEPRLVICDQATVASLEPVARSAGTKLMTLNQSGGGTLSDAADGCAPDFQATPRDEGDLAAILYTSGTTGRSKGAMLSHHNLWSNAEVLAEAWQFTEHDVLLHALPVFHTHGLFVATNVSMVAGGSMILLPGFKIDSVIKHLTAATSMMGVPTFYTRLLCDQRFTGELVKHTRLFISGSAPLLAETHHEFEERTGHRILERYGMTETSMNTSNPYWGDRRAGTVGPPLPGIEIRVVSVETGEPLAAESIGVIQVRGPNVFKGYWKMPDNTAEAFTRDGFFVTGDLGRLSEDHYLSIVGRKMDLIISGGCNVYPKEIELLLDSLDGVKESAVIGVPHPDLGEGVVAVLTGYGVPSEDEFKAIMRNMIAGFKQPKKYFYLDELPRNVMGKVQKNILKQRYADCFQS